jgi:hypothetical protein
VTSSIAIGVVIVVLLGASFVFFSKSCIVVVLLEKVFIEFVVATLLVLLDLVLDWSTQAPDVLVLILALGLVVLPGDLVLSFSNLFFASPPLHCLYYL